MPVVFTVVFICLVAATVIAALVLFARMPIQTAVGTSLFIIAFVSLSGVFSNFAAGRLLALDVTALFVGGGVFGLFLGARLAINLPASSHKKFSLPA